MGLVFADTVTSDTQAKHKGDCMAVAPEMWWDKAFSPALYQLLDKDCRVMLSNTFTISVFSPH